MKAVTFKAKLGLQLAVFSHLPLGFKLFCMSLVLFFAFFNFNAPVLCFHVFPILGVWK